MKKTLVASLLFGMAIDWDDATLLTTALQYPSRPRIMEGAGNIVLPIEPDDALCDIDVMNRRSTEKEVLSNADVNFWYAIGTSQFQKKDRILFELNQWIYKTMQETNVWCTPMFNNETQSNAPLGVVTFIPSGSTTSEDRTY
jgi:hypothetical protein